MHFPRFKRHYSVITILNQHSNKALKNVYNISLLVPSTHPSLSHHFLKSSLYRSHPLIVFVANPTCRAIILSPIKNARTPLKLSSCVNFVPPGIDVLGSNMKLWLPVKMNGIEPTHSKWLGEFSLGVSVIRINFVGVKGAYDDLRIHLLSGGREFDTDFVAGLDRFVWTKGCDGAEEIFVIFWEGFEVEKLKIVSF